MTDKTAKELSRLTRIRDAKIRQKRREGKSEDYITSYKRGWSTGHYRLVG